MHSGWRRQYRRAGGSFNLQLAIDYPKLGKLGTLRRLHRRALKPGSGQRERAVDRGSGIRTAERYSQGGEKGLLTPRSSGCSDPNIQNNYAGFLSVPQSRRGEKPLREVAREPGVSDAGGWALGNRGVRAQSRRPFSMRSALFARALAFRQYPEACCAGRPGDRAAMRPRRSISCRRYLA